MLHNHTKDFQCGIRSCPPIQNPDILPCFLSPYFFYDTVYASTAEEGGQPKRKRRTESVVTMEGGAGCQYTNTWLDTGRQRGEPERARRTGTRLWGRCQRSGRTWQLRWRGTGANRWTLYTSGLSCTERTVRRSKEYVVTFSEFSFNIPNYTREGQSIYP